MQYLDIIYNPLRFLCCWPFCPKHCTGRWSCWNNMVLWTWAKHVYQCLCADFKASPLRPLKVGNDSTLEFEDMWFFKMYFIFCKHDIVKCWLSRSAPFPFKKRLTGAWSEVMSWSSNRTFTSTMPKALCVDYVSLIFGLWHCMHFFVGLNHKVMCCGIRNVRRAKKKWRKTCCIWWIPPLGCWQF